MIADHGGEYPACRSSLWRGAWIETNLDTANAINAASRSSLWRGAWIETKLVARDFASPAHVAPLYGEGRGLKPRRLRQSSGNQCLVAPLYGEGRGLKQRRCVPGIGPLVAPLYGEGRGLKLCQPVCSGPESNRRSSLWRGAWIETVAGATVLNQCLVAPLYGEGRGLKLVLDGSRPTTERLKRRSSLWRGAWIETHRRDLVPVRRWSLLSMERGVD